MSWRKSSPWSITGRMTLLYTLSALGLLLLASAFLYRTLATSLQDEESRSLAERISELREILRTHPEDPATLQEEIQLEGIGLHATAYYFRVPAPGGAPFVASLGMEKLFADAPFPAPDTADPAHPAGIPWRARNGVWYLLLSSGEPWDGKPENRLIQAAGDISDDVAMLAAFREKLVLTLLAGVLLSAAIGGVVARLGMQPLAEIARTASQVTAHHLDRRIDPARWPAELTALARAFDDMLERLEKSFNRLSQFSADLAHELRTPIHNLRGEAEVALTRERSPEEYREVLASTLEECQRLSRMVDGLLFLARAESPETSVARLSLDGRRELEAVVEFHAPLAEEGEVRLTLSGEGAVCAEPMLLRRAVGNLLANALAHTPPGGEVAVQLEEVPGKGTRILVRDTGRGIPPAHLPHVFDRFYRVDRNRPRGGDGVHAGLGLALVRSIMHLHQGEVSLESPPEQGVTATLFFPEDDQNVIRESSSRQDR